MPVMRYSRRRGRSNKSKRGGRAARAMPEMEEPEMMYDDAMEYDSFSSGESSSEKLKKKKNSRVVRSHFPETWLFQLKPVDEKGKAVVSLKVIIIIQVVIIVVTPLLITDIFVTQGARHPHFVDWRGRLHEQERWNWTCQPIAHCGQEGQYYNLLCETLQIVVFVLAFEQQSEEVYRISLLTCAFPIL